MSDDKDESWRESLRISRPCGACKEYFKYSFGDLNAECPKCGWKVYETRSISDESKRETGENKG